LMIRLRMVWLFEPDWAIFTALVIICSPTLQRGL